MRSEEAVCLTLCQAIKVGIMALFALVALVMLHHRHSGADPGQGNGLVGLAQHDYGKSFEVKYQATELRNQSTVSLESL